MSAIPQRPKRKAKPLSKENEKYLVWFFFTIILPLLPILVKVFIYFFAKNENQNIPILDPSELLFYTIFIGVFTTYEIFTRDQKTLMIAIIGIASLFIALGNIVLTVILYLRQGSDASYTYAIAVTITMIFTACICKKREEGN